jgi:hypothetical protein
VIPFRRQAAGNGLPDQLFVVDNQNRFVRHS